MSFEVAATEPQQPLVVGHRDAQQAFLSFRRFFVVPAELSPLSLMPFTVGHCDMDFLPNYCTRAFQVAEIREINEQRSG